MGISRRVTLAVAAVAAVTLAACGSSDGKSSETSASPTASTSQSTVASPSSTAAVVPAGSTAAPTTEAPTPGSGAVAESPEGTLRIGAVVALTSFDPQASTDFAASFLYPEYDTLTQQDANGEPQPSLATSWERVDELTWRYELRDDVTFHDGSKFDATVVKKNIDRAQGLASTPSAAQLKSIAEARVVDPYTIDLVYKSPTAVSPIDLSLTAGMMISGAAIDAGTDLTRAPAGSGAWIWNAAESKEGSTQVYDLNPNYWNPAAQGVERVTVLHIGDSQARVNALIAGEVDMIDGASTSLQSSIEDAGAQLVTNPIGFSGLFLGDRVGLLSPELEDPRVREAIGLSIDRVGYQEAVDSGIGEASVGFFPAGTKWHDSQLADAPEPDYDKAKELLKEAGYPNGFTFKLATYPTIDAGVQAIVQMLAPAGINVELVQIQGNGTAEVIKGNFVGTWVSTRAQHPQTLYQNYVATNGTLNQAFQATDMTDLDARMAEAATLTDDDAQKTIYDEVFREIVDRNFLFVFNHAGNAGAVGHGVIGAYLGGGQLGPRPTGVRVGTS